MSSVVELLDHCQAVLNFDPNYVISHEDLEKIIECGRIAPTAFTAQDIDILVCTNREKNQNACDEQLKILPKDEVDKLTKRLTSLNVKNVITCDASVEVILYKNERGNTPSTPIHVGLTGMSICAAAKEYGLDTMCHHSMIGEAAENIYGIPKGTSVMAIAIGKALPNAHIDKKVHDIKVSYIK